MSRAGAVGLGVGLAVAVVAWRTAVVGAIDAILVVADLYYVEVDPRHLPEDLAGVVAGVVSGLGGAFAWQRGRAGLGTHRALALGVAGLVVAAAFGGKLAWHATHEFALEVSAPREVGRFPYPAGREVVFERGGYVGTTVIGPDGHRRCSPDDATVEGDVDVVMIGDSYVFGLALDDAGTLCWQLREQLEGTHPGRFRLRNLGQPGANLRGYLDTLRYARASFPMDVAVVGILIPDDSFVYDLNTAGPTFDHPIGMAIGTVLHPKTVWALQQVYSRRMRSEGFQQAFLRDALWRLGEAADGLDVPVIAYFYDTPSRSHEGRGWFNPYLRWAEEAAAAHPRLTFAGVLTAPRGKGTVWTIPGDGHPTVPTNAWYATQVAAVLGARWGGAP